MSELPKGYFSVGSKLYTVCPDCNSIVQVNKFILGSVHFCTDEASRKVKRDEATSTTKNNSQGTQRSQGFLGSGEKERREDAERYPMGHWGSR